MTKIIAFEGIDGTGKSVQMQRLSDALKARGLRVLEISFPMYDTFFGDLVGRYLSNKDGVPANTVDGKSMALWFALDRFEAFQALDYFGYDVLLINRYVLSNAVYQSIRDVDLGKPDLLDFCLTLEHDHFRIPVPDLYLVLDVAPEDAALNVDKKGFRDYVGNTRDVYESIGSIQDRARRKYAEYAARIPNIRLIPCMENGALLPIDTIAKRVEDVVVSELFAKTNERGDSLPAFLF